MISSEACESRQLRELQEQTDRTDYLQALANLAGNAAHELNNILGPLLGYPDILLHCLPRDSSMRQDLLVIKNSARRAMAVVQELSIFCNSGMLEPVSFHLNNVIEQFLQDGKTREICRELPRLNIVTDLADGLPPVMFSEMPVRHLLQTLLERVLEDSCSDIVLRISTRCLPVADHRAPAGGAPGPWVLLEIHDGGLILDAQHLAVIYGASSRRPRRRVPHHVFILALFHAALRRCGGAMVARSAAPAGMCLGFYLPLVKDIRQSG